MSKFPELDKERFPFDKVLIRGGLNSAESGSFSSSGGFETTGSAGSGVSIFFEFSVVIDEIIEFLLILSWT